MTQPTPKPLPCVPGNPFVLVPLHQFPEFTFPCANLLNMEWPRSQQSRLNGLWSCSRQFPVAMVLVECDVRQVVGFCKVSLIPGMLKACFVQSVVVHPEKRGKGLGSLLMTKLEDYVRSRKLNTVYLSTLGQEKFYSKLGYSECEPISLYAFGLNSSIGEIYSKLTDLRSKTKLKSDIVNRGTGKEINNDQNMKDGPVASGIPPPPPPPKDLLGNGIMTTKTCMKKVIA